MVRDNLVISDARIGFRNFSGKETRFNNEGNRNFCWFIEDLELAEQLERDGWNVRFREAREANDPGFQRQAYMQVAVSYNNIPPTIMLVTNGQQTRLEESEVSMLDWAEIRNVDMIIRPYNWSVGGRSGVKGYVHTMYVTIADNPFADKYRDIPSSDNYGY